ncbi:Gfo/Idh/MocA family protein [Nocardiopsis alborubida]|uniref:Gfo/Idh/MocA family oxidoreductase n=1 Tax=Nocardiopsis alborubida TaxID=146802 RepID=A0A7X6M8L2_9ACTN|nr:Gfo/Idh/MocA family oxidoreductase [Nocardiopsis alborubida]NKY96642.1 Gfo/Idh/MocA family oxidoreductase [Nocardiopsis alborubida]
MIVGCGMVAQEYMATLTAHPDLVRVTACADLDLDRARAFADRHDLTPVTVEQAVEGRAGDLVVILTPPHTHLALAEQAVAAGVAVYLEKPFGDDAAAARRLLDRAQAQGVALGCAPDTILAPPARLAAQLIEEGRLGSVTSASATLVGPGPESWHPAPQALYGQGAGPLRDMGPYYLSMLVHLLGPVSTVHGSAQHHRTPRHTPGGESFPAQSPTHVNALLGFTSGASATLTVGWDGSISATPHLEVRGTEATLTLPDPNFHHGALRLRRSWRDPWEELHPPAADPPPGRGIGVLATARHLTTSHPQWDSAELALHVLHLIETIEHAATREPCPVPAHTR